MGPLSKTVTVGVIQLDVLGSWSEVHVAGALLGSKGFFEMRRGCARCSPRRFTTLLRNETPPIPFLFDIPDKAAARPQAQLVSPIVIGSVGTAILVLEEVLRYEDGFEIHLRLEGEALPSEMNEIRDDVRSKLAPNQVGRIDIFDGLQLEVLFLDGRVAGTLKVSMYNDGRGNVIANRFWRPPNDPRDLWLWISPLPSPGQVQVNAIWPRYGITNTSVSFNVVSR